MKTKFFIALAIIISAGVFANSLCAQPLKDESSMNQFVNDLVKLPVRPSGGSANKVPADVAHLRAANHFKKHFRDHHEAWSDGSDCITAGYTENEEKMLVYYNKKGRWVASLKSYGKEKLPRSVRELISDEFCGYDIDGAYEIEAVESNDYPIYVVVIENSKKIKNVVVQNGVLRVFKEFDKYQEGS